MTNLDAKDQDYTECALKNLANWQLNEGVLSLIKAKKAIEKLISRNSMGYDIEKILEDSN